jgi:sulfofructose kinase
MSVLDLVQLVEVFPSAGGVTRVLDSTLMGGGPVPTALCAAARLGSACTVLDRLGDDWRGDLILADYERHGVDSSFLLREPGKRCTFGTVLVRRSDGERHLLYDEGDFTPLEFSELPRSLLETCRVLHLNGRHWPACLEAASVVKNAGGLVSFDGGAHRYEPRHEDWLPRVDLLIVAADYARSASGCEDRSSQLESLARHGASVVGITDGVQGSWFLAGGELFHQPALPATPLVDTTGCGDVFHGAFLAGIVQGREVRDCARRASAAAALAATALGGRGFLPDEPELESFLARFPFP